MPVFTYFCCKYPIETATVTWRAFQIVCPCVEGPNALPRAAITKLVDGFRSGLRDLVSIEPSTTMKPSIKDDRTKVEGGPGGWLKTDM